MSPDGRSVPPGRFDVAAVRPVRVFIAEDEALIRMDLVESLQELGYEVAGSAGDGETALNLLQTADADVALLDISMPILDGLTLARMLTDQGRCAVVIVTAYSQRDLVRQAVEAGAMAYVVKPFTPHELVPAIEVARTRFAEAAALRDEVDQLSDSLETRKLVDRAKGRLMRDHGITEENAFRLLQRRAMDTRSSMAEVARAVLGAS